MDIVTLAAARKGGGSGGDVTKQYVDEHLALKADKTETAKYPIASTTTGINPTITDSADGLIQDITVYGRSDVSKNLFGFGVNAVDKTEEYRANPAQRLVIVNSDTNNIEFRYSGGAWSMAYIELPIDGTKTYSISYDVTASQYTPTIRVDTSMSTSSRLVLLIYGGNGETQVPETVSFTISNIQLELGSEPTPYEPYFSGIRGIGEDGELEITTANSDNTASTTAPLTTGLPLCGIPVTTGETYTDGDGVKWLADTADVEGVVKRTYKVTFDGSENWTLDEGSLVGASGSRRITAIISDIPVTNVITTDAVPTIICNSLTPASRNKTYADNDNTISVLVQNNANEFQTRVSGIATAADLKTYLASNPVTVVYELAEPYEIPLTSAEKSALRNLRTFDSTTNITITDSPTVDIGYLLNTANGQAVADAIDNAITGVLNTSY